MIPGPLKQEFRRNLLRWYDEAARDLPWRRTKDPYAIWVSEIMLQQTRVAAVLDHYDRFLRRFPTVQALAAASEDDVLALWSGLGYYRRARMMHRAAKVVAEEMGGKFPETAAGLRVLPGIGEYTSAAIGSIAFGDAAAAVDGNVERVLTRVLGWDEATASVSRVREAAAEMLAVSRPGDYNQAMMELGATTCLPRGPLCLQCPVQGQCATRGEHVVGERKKMVSKRVAYAFVQRTYRGVEQVMLVQRAKDASLMAGMWELPAVDEPGSERLLLEVKHSITVTNYHVSVYGCAVGELAVRGEWVAVDELAGIPLTGLARKVLKRLKVFPGHGVGPEAVGSSEVMSDLLG